MVVVVVVGSRGAGQGSLVSTSANRQRAACWHQRAEEGGEATASLDCQPGLLKHLQLLLSLLQQAGNPIPRSGLLLQRARDQDGRVHQVLQEPR